MENNLKIHPDKYCRTCLMESNDMKSLSEKINGENRTLRDILNFVANINAFVIHPLPKRVCGDCETILIKADAFKRRYLESESILTQLFDVATFSQIVDNIANNSLIKDENCFGTSLIEDLQQTAGSQSSEKAKLLDNSEKFDEKPDRVILPRASDYEKNILAKVTEYEVEVVKEEIDIEFDSQEDNSCDFGESEPLELKKETERKEPAFICHCGSQFQAKAEYLLHLHTRKCNGRRKTSKLKKVEKFTEVKKAIVCSICNLVFKTSKALKIHEKSHSKVADETGTFECTVCMRKFSRKSSWATHMKHHDMKSNIKFTCDTCKREFQHKAHLDNHILSVHTREKGYTCEICSTNFATIESLELHKDSHKIEKKHRCKICSKAFYMLSSLNDHLRVHTGEKPYLCSICGKGFSQKTNLAQHVRRHQGLKPFKCEHCDRRFVSKGELVAHTRKHSGAHPFVCDDCGSGFTTSSSLVKHRRVHTGERPYACDLCPRRFAASGTLKNHRRTHTGEKPFQCSYCEKAFVQRQDLVSHIRGHTGERPYTCGCGQAFRKASSLKAHVRLHGKEPQRDLSLLLQASVPTVMAEVNNQTG